VKVPPVSMPMRILRVPGCSGMAPVFPRRDEAATAKPAQ
jgi:hypothetical protein